MNDKSPPAPKPLKAVVTAKGKTDKPEMGSHDILGSILDGPFPCTASRLFETLGECLDFARDNGLWIATYGLAAGAISPEEVEKRVTAGEKLFQIVGVPPNWQPGRGADVNVFEFLDPMKAVQILRARSESATQAAGKILETLKARPLDDA